MCVCVHIPLNVKLPLNNEMFSLNNEHLNVFFFLSSLHPASLACSVFTCVQACLRMLRVRDRCQTDFIILYHAEPPPVNTLAVSKRNS